MHISPAVEFYSSAAAIAAAVFIANRKITRWLHMRMLKKEFVRQLLLVQNGVTEIYRFSK